MKKIPLRLSFFLAFFLLVFVFYSCQKNATNPEPPANQNRKLLTEIRGSVSPNLDTFLPFYSFKYDSSGKMTEVTDSSYYAIRTTPTTKDTLKVENALFNYNEKGQLAAVDFYYTGKYYGTQNFRYTGNTVEQSEYVKDSAKTIVSTTYTFKASGELEKYSLRNFRFKETEETSFTYDATNNTLNREGLVNGDAIGNIPPSVFKYSTKYSFDDKKGMMLNVNSATPWWWFAAKYNLAYTSSFMFFSLAHNISEADDMIFSNNTTRVYQYNYIYDNDGYPISMKVFVDNVEKARYTFKYSR